MISYADKNIVIDTGPDFRRQMLENNFTSVDAVVFTHAHKDHIAGLDDIRPINYLQRKFIDVYAEPYVQQALHREYPYIFAKDYPGVPLINLHTIDETNAFVINEREWMPIRVMHMNMPVLGFRINNLVYITDANFIDEKELNKCRGVKVLVLNALHHQKHYSHFNLEEALKIVDILQPEQTYFTHISHHMGFIDEINETLPYNVHLAYDGLSIEL
jgi:phosphoribosyl 1,2-cyclic phosphate phosphodiesterase